MNDDRELFERFRAGSDAQAFAELVGRYAGLVYGTALRVTGNAHDAEEVSQECFLALYRDCRETPRSVSAWLHRVAVNRAINRLRGDARRRQHETAAPQPASAEQPGWEKIAPLVDRALEDLPEELREPLMQRYLHERTQEEIAERLGVDRSTVSRRLDKGLDALRERLAKAGVACAAVALAALLERNACQAAPPALVGLLQHLSAGQTAAGASAEATAASGITAAKVAIAAGVLGAGVLTVALLMRPAAPPPTVVAAPTTTTTMLAVAPPTTLPPAPPTNTPVLLNERRLFAAGEATWIDLNRYVYSLQARLSPDAKYLLHARPEGVVTEGRRQPRRLWVREIASGHDQVVETETRDDELNAIFLRFGSFDPTGGKLLLLDTHGSVQDPRTAEYEATIYSLDGASFAPTGIKAWRVVARFDRTGAGLFGTRVPPELRRQVLFQYDLAQKTLTEIPLGWEAGNLWFNSICPTADVVCIYGVEQLPPAQQPAQEPERAPPLPVRRPRPERRQTLRLYETGTWRHLATLPSNPKNSQLDDLESLWTPDGRYVCYLDYVGEGESEQTIITRIWDRVAGEEKAFVPNAAPIGPGPGGSQIVLARVLGWGPQTDHRPILHDAADGRSRELGDETVRPLHAAGGKMAYIKMLPDGAMEVRVADIGSAP